MSAVSRSPTRVQLEALALVEFPTFATDVALVDARVTDHRHQFFMEKCRRHSVHVVKASFVFELFHFFGHVIKLDFALPPRYRLHQRNDVRLEWVLWAERLVGEYQRVVCGVDVEMPQMVPAHPLVRPLFHVLDQLFQSVLPVGQFLQCAHLWPMLLTFSFSKVCSWVEMALIDWFVLRTQICSAE